MKHIVDSNLIRLGVRLKEARLRKGWTLEQAARSTQLSKGLLSKIENFRTVPSVPVLCVITRALEADLAEVLKGIGSEEGATKQPYVLTRADERPKVERGDSSGFDYRFLGSSRVPSESVETFVLHIPAQSRRKKVTTNGEEFIFVLEGSIHFILGETTIPMEQGDSLLFDGRIPHTPRCQNKKAATLLVAYILQKES